MCIALISTAHPSYPLILINNRDEYLSRPTAPADWWPEPNSHVLAGHDLLRAVYGSWLGVTRTGRIAVLTNFREDGNVFGGRLSRGAILNAFLTEAEMNEGCSRSKGNGTTESFVQEIVNSGLARDVGGFSLVCGMVGEPLAVVSNRAQKEADVPWIGTERGQTVGLSNGPYSDRSWQKVRNGEMLMDEALRASVACAESEDGLIERLLAVLSHDTLPRQKDESGLETYIHLLQHTIFVPAIGQKDLPADEVAAARKDAEAQILEVKAGQRPLGMSGLYGTQKQTVVLVGHEGRIRFFERTLYDNDVNPVPLGCGDRDFDFWATERSVRVA